MSTYTPNELLQRWKNGKVGTTQAIGHILQHLVTIYEQDERLAERVNTLTKLLDTPDDQQSKQSAKRARQRS